MKMTADTTLRALAMALVVATSSSLILRGQDEVDIVDHITADGVNKIVQPEALRRLIVRASFLAVR